MSNDLKGKIKSVLCRKYRDAKIMASPAQASSTSKSTEPPSNTSQTTATTSNTATATANTATTTQVSQLPTNLPAEQAQSESNATDNVSSKNNGQIEQQQKENKQQQHQKQRQFVSIAYECQQCTPLGSTNANIGREQQQKQYEQQYENKQTPPLKLKLPRLLLPKSPKPNKRPPGKISCEALQESENSINEVDDFVEGQTSTDLSYDSLPLQPSNTLPLLQNCKGLEQKQHEQPAQQQQQQKQQHTHEQVMQQNDALEDKPEIDNNDQMITKQKQPTETLKQNQEQHNTTHCATTIKPIKQLENTPSTSSLLRPDDKDRNLTTHPNKIDLPLISPTRIELESNKQHTLNNTLSQQHDKINKETHNNQLQQDQSKVHRYPEVSEIAIEQADQIHEQNPATTSIQAHKQLSGLSESTQIESICCPVTSSLEQPFTQCQTQNGAEALEDETEPKTQQQDLQIQLKHNLSKCDNRSLSKENPGQDSVKTSQNINKPLETADEQNIGIGNTNTAATITKKIKESNVKDKNNISMVINKQIKEMRKLSLCQQWPQLRECAEEEEEQVEEEEHHPHHHHQQQQQQQRHDIRNGSPEGCCRGSICKIGCVEETQSLFMNSPSCGSNIELCCKKMCKEDENFRRQTNVEQGFEHIKQVTDDNKDDESELIRGEPRRFDNSLASVDVSFSKKECKEQENCLRQRGKKAMDGGWSDGRTSNKEESTDAVKHHQDYHNKQQQQQQQQLSLSSSNIQQEQQPEDDNIKKDNKPNNVTYECVATVSLDKNEQDGNKKEANEIYNVHLQQSDKKQTSVNNISELTAHQNTDENLENTGFSSSSGSGFESQQRCQNDLSKQTNPSYSYKANIVMKESSEKQQIDVESTPIASQMHQNSVQIQRHELSSNIQQAIQETKSEIQPMIAQNEEESKQEIRFQSLDKSQFRTENSESSDYCKISNRLEGSAHSSDSDNDSDDNQMNIKSVDKSDVPRNNIYYSKDQELLQQRETEQKPFHDEGKLLVQQLEVQQRQPREQIETESEDDIKTTPAPQQQQEEPEQQQQQNHHRLQQQQQQQKQQHSKSPHLTNHNKMQPNLAAEDFSAKPHCSDHNNVDHEEDQQCSYPNEDTVSKETGFHAQNKQSSTKQIVDDSNTTREVFNKNIPHKTNFEISNMYQEELCGEEDGFQTTTGMVYNHRQHFQNMKEESNVEHPSTTEFEEYLQRNDSVDSTDQRILFDKLISGNDVMKQPTDVNGNDVIKQPTEAVVANSSTLSVGNVLDMQCNEGVIKCQVFDPSLEAEMEEHFNDNIRIKGGIKKDKIEEELDEEEEEETTMTMTSETERPSSNDDDISIANRNNDEAIVNNRPISVCVGNDAEVEGRPECNKKLNGVPLVDDADNVTKAKRKGRVKVSEDTSNEALVLDEYDCGAAAGCEKRVDVAIGNEDNDASNDEDVDDEAMNNRDDVEIVTKLSSDNEKTVVFDDGGVCIDGVISQNESQINCDGDCDDDEEDQDQEDEDENVAAVAAAAVLADDDCEDSKLFDVEGASMIANYASDDHIKDCDDNDVDDCFNDNDYGGNYDKKMCEEKDKGCVGNCISDEDVKQTEHDACEGRSVTEQAGGSSDNSDIGDLRVVGHDGLMDVNSLLSEVRDGTAQLNSLLGQHRMNGQQTQRLLSCVHQLKREVSKVTSANEKSQSVIDALQQEVTNQRTVLATACDLTDVPRRTAQLQRVESKVYRRYLNMMSEKEAKGILKSIGIKQKSLAHLESLVHRKRMILKHALPVLLTSDQTQASKLPIAIKQHRRMVGVRAENNLLATTTTSAPDNPQIQAVTIQILARPNIDTGANASHSVTPSDSSSIPSSHQSQGDSHTTNASSATSATTTTPVHVISIPSTHSDDVSIIDIGPRNLGTLID